LGDRAIDFEEPGANRSVGPTNVDAASRRWQ
jgi:hypothetical protein